MSISKKIYTAIDNPPEKTPQIKEAVKFISLEKNGFFSAVRKRVDAYFIQNHLSKFGNKKLLIKTITLLLVYILPFAFILFAEPGFLINLFLWAVMGLGIAGLGMCVMHDANHGAFSANKIDNWLMAHVLNIIGGSTFNWKLQHNILHHTYTNITDMDDDITSKPALRLSPHTPVNRWHRYQWVHSFFLYGLTTLYWVTAKDFIQWVRYRKNGVNTASRSKNRWLLINIIILKIVYFSTFIILPVWVLQIPVTYVLTGFLTMHFIAGLTLTVVFQLAHSLEGTAHPLPNGKGIIENDWAIHQMNTTTNFAANNKWLSWYIGGLNFQVEHHLFPKISHVHYPAIAPIVRATAAEFHVSYLEYDTFIDALRAHIRFLKKLGRLPNLNDAMG